MNKNQYSKTRMDTVRDEIKSNNNPVGVNLICEGSSHTITGYDVLDYFAYSSKKPTIKVKGGFM